jgi:hypothetical protein
MVGFSSRPRASSSDEIPLNKSFDTHETSDSYQSQDSKWSNKSVMTVWGLSENIQQTKQRRTSLSSEETLQVRNTGKRGATKKSWRTDLATHYSPSLGITFESADGEEIFCDEYEPRAVIVPRLPVPGAIEVRDRVHDPEFFDGMVAMRNDDNMIGMRADLNQRWQNPMKRCGDEGETISSDGVWKEKFAPPLDPAVQVDSIEESRARAHEALDRASRQEDANCHEIVWTAWGCNDTKTRRRVICIVLMFLVTVAVMGFLIGLFLANETATETDPITENQPVDAHNDGSDWIADEPGHRPFENPGVTPPTGRPTLVATPASAMASTSETGAPSKSPNRLTKRPVLDTVPPDLPLPTRSPVAVAETPTRNPAPSPVTTPTRNPTPSPVTTPTRNPTPSPVVQPTAKPVILTSSPTQLPFKDTRNPTPAPTPCQSSLTVDKSCYVEDQDVIVIEFLNCDPQDDDWVGIWLASEDPENLSDRFYTWAWSCGTQSCLGAPSTMRMAFEAYGLGFDSFRAFLVHEAPDDDPYFSHAMSAPFTVTDDCSR